MPKITSQEKYDRAAKRMNQAWLELHYEGLGVPLNKAAKRYQRAEWVFESRLKGKIAKPLNLSDIRIAGSGKWGTRSEPGKPSSIWSD